jgi:hypothetical protein
MSRSLVVLLVVVVVLVGGMVVLAGRAHDKPLTHVEKVVTLANLQG